MTDDIRPARPRLGIVQTPAGSPEDKGRPPFLDRSRQSRAARPMPDRKSRDSEPED